MNAQLSLIYLNKLGLKFSNTPYLFTTYGTATYIQCSKKYNHLIFYHGQRRVAERTVKTTLQVYKNSEIAID